MIHDDANFVTLHEAPAPLDGLHVHLVRGSESLGRSFSYTIGLFGTPIAQDVTLSEIIGRKLTLAIKTSEDGVDLDGDPLPKTRYLGGMIRRFWQLDAETHGIENHVVYELELVPTIGILETRTNSRIFQDRTTLQIVDLVLADHGIRSNRDASRLGDTWPWKQRDYCVQFNETDLAFVQRLLEEEGIAYFFEHSELGDTLVLASEETHYTAFNESYTNRKSRISDSSLDPFAGEYGTLELNRAASLTGESLASWCRQWTRRPSRFESMDFDAKQTSAASQVIRRQRPDDDSTNGPGTRYEAYAGLGREEGETDTTDTGYLESLADIRRAELTSKNESWIGKTHSRGVATGHRYEVQTASELATYLAIRCELLIQRVRGIGNEVEQATPDVIPEPGTNNTSWTQDVSLEAIRSTVRYVPDRVTPRPRMHGPHTAFVVNDDGELPDASQTTTQPASMDDHARVRVRMHWNLDPELDEQDAPIEVGSSNPRSHPWPTCRLRVAQPTASKGWGTWAVPHIGDEVLVSFINGDPDRPVITGRLYNAARVPSDEMPAEPIPSPTDQPRTNHMQVMSDVAGNHLVMNSENGKEQILLHSPQPGGKGSQVWIGSERNVELTYASDVISAMFGGSSSSAQARDGIGVYSDGNYTVKIQGNDVQQIEGNSFEVVTGIDYGVTFGGSIEATFGFDISAFVGLQVEYTLGFTYSQSASVSYEVTNEKGYGFHFNDAGEASRGTHEIFGGEKVVLGGGGTVPTLPKAAQRAMMAVPVAPLVASLASSLTGGVMPKEYKSALLLDKKGAVLYSGLEGANDADFFNSAPQSSPRIAVSAEGKIAMFTEKQAIAMNTNGKAIELLAAKSGDKIVIWSAGTVEIKAKEIKLTGKVTANGVQISAPPAPPPPPRQRAASVPAAPEAPDTTAADVARRGSF